MYSVATTDVARANGSATHKETRRLSVELTALFAVCSLLILQLFGSTDISLNQLTQWTNEVRRAGKEVSRKVLGARANDRSSNCPANLARYPSFSFLK